MATAIHAGKRRQYKLMGLDADGVTVRPLDLVHGLPVVSSSDPTHMTVVLNLDPTDGGAADGSVVEPAHNGLAPGSDPVDCDMLVEADADMGDGAKTVTGKMTFTIMPEEVPPPPEATSVGFTATGEEIPKR